MKRIIILTLAPVLERWEYPWGDSCIVAFAGDRVFKNVYNGPVR
jgi:hypothetical protein